MKHQVVQLKSGRVVNAIILERRHYGNHLVNWAGIVTEATALSPTDILRIEREAGK